MTNSENDSNKKRGRPRLMPAEAEAAYRAIWGAVSERTLQNRKYESRALRILLPDGLGQAPPDHPYLYLFDADHPTKGVRHVMLAELGRVDEPETLVELARHICVNRLPTGAAVALIRRVRLGNQPPPTDRLVDVLLAAIDAHVTRYRDDHAHVLAALHEVMGIVESHATADESG